MVSLVAVRASWLGFLLLVFLGTSNVRAATLTVTTVADSGPGSLRSAIADASPGDTINFSVTGTITLASTLMINTSLTISGPGASSLAISGNNLVPVFLIDTATVGISGVTVEDGDNDGGAGAGIYNNGGTVTLTNSSLSDNSTGVGGGGAIYNLTGKVTLNNSIVSGSVGGGIINWGTLTLINSTVSGNSTQPILQNIDTGYIGGMGGGITNTGTGTATLINSTLSNNSAVGGGGGIINYGTMTLTNSTLSGNSSNGFKYGISEIGGVGGGIENYGTMTLTNSTLSGNSAVGGIGVGGGIASSGTLTVKNSIVANSPMGGDCANSGSLTSDGHNLTDDGTCSGLFTNSSDLNNTPAGLDPAGLQNNGGPTQTIALLSTSFAVDAIPVSPVNYCTATDGMAAIATDQRGVPRPQGSGCDIGAYEYVSTASGTVSVTVSTFPAGLSFTVDGVTYTTPQVFVWLINSPHNIATTSPQSPGYAFTGWSDGGMLSHTVIASAATTSYTANFLTSLYFLSATSATFTVGTRGALIVTVNGSPTPVLSYVGSLPSGLAFVDNLNGTATLGGTPGTGGVYQITVIASNNYGLVSQLLTLTVQSQASSQVNFGFDFRATSGYVVDPSYAAPVIGETFPHTYTNGASATISAGFVGGNVACVNRSMSVDTRLAGACYNASSNENAPPTSTVFTVTLPSAGSWTIALAAGDASYPQQQFITLLDNGTAFATYSAKYTAAGGFMDATGTVYLAANWDTSNATLTHTFVSTTFSIQVGPTTAAGTGGLNTFLSFLQISQAPPSLQITTTALPSGTVGTAYSQSLAASGGTMPYKWSSGGLPAGLSLNSSTGLINGTPTVTNSGAISFLVTDSTTPTAQTATVNLPLTISAAGSSSTNFGFDFRATSGYVADPSYAAPVTGETFPHTYTNGVNATISAGFVGGNVACVNRTASLDARLAGACYNASGNENAPPTSTVFTVTLPSAGSWTIALAAGDYFYPQEQYITLLDNGIPFATYSAVNTLGAQPDDMNFMDATGVVPINWAFSNSTLTHTFTSTTFSIQVGPTTAAGTGGLNTFLSFLEVSQGSSSIPSPLQITTTVLPNGTVGTPYSQSLAAIGGTMPYTWSSVGLLLPAGLSLNSSTGLISGTPTVPFSNELTFQVTDSMGDTTGNIVPLTISAVGSPNTNFGFDFRATSGYVTDPSYAAPVIGETFPHNYTNGTGTTVSAGFVGGNVTCVNRSTSVDPRLAGACYNSSSNESVPPTSTVFTVTLPSAGTWTISLAAGDASYPQEQYITLWDNGTAFATYSAKNTSAGSFMDATGAVYAASNWLTSSMTLTHTFTSTTFSIQVGPTTAAGTGGLNTFLSFLQVSQAPTPPVFGFDFRATSGYVADPSYAAPVLGETFPHTYINGAGATISAGFGGVAVGPVGLVTCVNRTTSVDVRLAGGCYNSSSNESSQPWTVFTVTLPSSGSWTISLAAGDASYPQEQYITLKDGVFSNGTVFATYSGENTPAGSFMDATGSIYPAANWPSSDMTFTHTFTSTTLSIQVGPFYPAGTAGLSTFLSFLKISQASP